MNTRLAGILAQKQKEVERLKKRGLSIDRGNDALPIRDFKGAISKQGRINLIAEIKFASPSTGIIVRDKDPVQIARTYQKAGAGAISLLTDKRFFSGDMKNLPRIKGAISLPLLRKDFIIDPIQVEESVRHGADAVLLIARLLSRRQLSDLLAACREFGLAPLTEIHDREDLEKGVACGARIIGINNRDLDTFKVNIKTTLDLAPLVPESCVVVSESGITTGQDIRLLKKAAVDAVLVGTSLMKSSNISAKTRELVEAGRNYGKG
ncbi:MAG: indole-3-glycerol phosphate synthase TrpC [Deltaproteobacteria bacterium]|nr:indole-3-glycerol phosphate synthase TrpC [Deltaproteobacteria bacterium]